MLLVSLQVAGRPVALLWPWPPSPLHSGQSAAFAKLVRRRAERRWDFMKIYFARAARFCR
jgi:hypothetical protein